VPSGIIVISVITVGSAVQIKRSRLSSVYFNYLTGIPGHVTSWCHKELLHVTLCNVLRPVMDTLLNSEYEKNSVQPFRRYRGAQTDRLTDGIPKTTFTLPGGGEVEHHVNPSKSQDRFLTSMLRHITYKVKLRLTCGAACSQFVRT
jgi:hypothetical protein